MRNNLWGLVVVFIRPRPLFWIIMLLGIVSCEGHLTPSTNDLPVYDKVDIPIIDTLDKQQSKSATSNSDVASEIIKAIQIDSFLLKPFDVFAFKKKVGQFHSGSASRRSFYFKPTYRGMYYSFFLFSNLKGYWGENKDLILSKEKGLKITTYKPRGKYENQYLDPTEELIEVEARFNNFDLPELAFVGLDTTKVKNRLGEKSFFRENCFVYTYQNRALILGIKNGFVHWLRYVHMNAPLTKDTQVEGLYAEW
jgi:hypothetical protein